MSTDWDHFLQQQTLPTLASKSIAGSGFLALADRTVVEISGPDAADFLHGQFITDIKNMTAGSASLSAWCTPKGRIICHFILAFDGERYLLVLPQSLQQTFCQRLQMFVMRSQVFITDKQEEFACLGLLYDAAQAHLPIPTPELHTCMTTENAVYLSYMQNSTLILVDRRKAQQTWSTLAATSAVLPATQWLLHEIEAHSPWLDSQTTEAYIPQELSLDKLGIMSFEKGCYPGQEIIARLHYRGEVKRRLTLATVNITTPVHTASKILNSDGIKAGTVVMAVPLASEQRLMCVIDTAYQDDPNLHIDSLDDATLQYQ